MLNDLFTGAVHDLQRGLGYATRRHDVLTQNIANVETPGYRARDLVFASQLAASLAGAAGDAPRSATPAAPNARLVLANDGPPALNGNDVNLDRQMARLAENTLFHHALVQVLSGQFALLKQAVSGRT